MTWNGVVEAAGWTLAHFLWQGAILAALLALFLAALKRGPATARYAVACGAMLLLLVLPAATFLWLASQGSVNPVVIRALLFPPPTGAGDSLLVAPPARIAWQPWAVGLWICGVLALSLRWLGAWSVARRERREGRAIQPEWQARVEKLCERLAISRPVLALRTGLRAAPAVIGWLRPVVLVPAAAFASLAAEQLEAILAHELAHIRRNDYLVNLLQVVAETLLFYHPAVWWVSKQMRVEREHCCDDLAVSVCGDRVVYARALLQLEEMRGAGASLAMAADGAPLRERIGRLLGVERECRRPFPLAGLLLAVSIVVVLGWSAQGMTAQQGDKLRPYQKWVNEDVVYIIAPAERARFESLKTDAEREKFIEQFWKRRDPTPNTEANEFKEEHYRRIAYANQRFSAEIPGWKTDRGRIYIIYGPPDEIESHPGKSEAWLYHVIDGIGANVMVVFDDSGKLKAGPGK